MRVKKKSDKVLTRTENSIECLVKNVNTFLLWLMGIYVCSETTYYFTHSPTQQCTRSNRILKQTIKYQNSGHLFQ